MAKIESILKAELNPRTPIQDIMSVVEVMLHHNPGQAQVILEGVSEAVSTILERMEKKEVEADGN